MFVLQATNTGVRRPGHDSTALTLSTKIIMYLSYENGLFMYLLCDNNAR